MFKNLFVSALLLGLGMILLGTSPAVQAEEGGKDDAAAIAKQTETYPLKTCVVTGEELGSMGNPHDVLHEGRLVRFCCKGCVKKFKADPEKFLKQIDEAAAKGGEGKAAAEAAPKAGGGGGDKQTGCGGCAGAGKAPTPAAGDAAPKASGAKGGCGSGCGCGGCGR
jgi:hypothetical protein